ncbi:MAG: hypothetical protein ACRDY7_00225 [Acidimicrobiia bacterium]
MAVTANALAGLGGLAAWGRPGLRGRWVWVAAGLAEALLCAQVVIGVVLNSGDGYEAPRIHTFYGLVVFATVTIALASRDSMRGRLELLYGLVGLFLAGLGIRAGLQVV